VIVDGKDVIAVDVATRHPATESWAKRGARNEAGKAANDAEHQKHLHYRDRLGANIGATFMPFGIESYGTIGKTARELIRLLCERASFVGPQAVAAVRRELTTNLSLAIQRGNALAIVAGLQAARSAELERAKSRRDQAAPLSLGFSW
jgi:hypothetical protein